MSAVVSAVSVTHMLRRPFSTGWPVFGSVARPSRRWSACRSCRGSGPSRRTSGRRWPRACACASPSRRPRPRCRCRPSGRGSSSPACRRSARERDRSWTRSRPEAGDGAADADGDQDDAGGDPAVAQEVAHLLTWRSSWRSIGVTPDIGAGRPGKLRGFHGARIRRTPVAEARRAHRFPADRSPNRLEPDRERER